MLNIFATKFSAEFVDLQKKLSPKFYQNHFYILENIDRIIAEEELLHLINSASEAKAFLIMSSSSDNNFKLKDLSSRLKNIFVVQIKEPSIPTIKMLLVNAFGLKQIKVSSRVIDFIANNIERNYHAIFVAAKNIEDYCHQSAETLTLKNISKILLKS